MPTSQMPPKAKLKLNNQPPRLPRAVRQQKLVIPSAAPTEVVGLLAVVAVDVAALLMDPPELLILMDRLRLAMSM